MLIDCGILKGTPGGRESLKAAMQNVLEETAGKLDVLVVTHEHWDHISGFLMAQEEFAKLKIARVWLAWTEKRGNELADRLRSQRSKTKKAVETTSLKLNSLVGIDTQAAASLAAMKRLELFYADQDETSLGAQAASNSTSSAMDWAHHQSGGAVSYLDPHGKPLTIPGVKGVRFFVLGPPQDEAWIKKEDPSKKTPEVYSLASGNNLGFLAAMEAQGGTDGGRPFDASFELGGKQATQETFFQNSYFAEAEQWRKIEADWLWTAERLALQLDSDTNNTSLVLAIELVESGQVLLFPGDAQVGNWLSWEKLEWMVKNPQGGTDRVSAEDLLRRTVLYKVGHHGSHNATLREKGLELMAGEGMSALIPVYEAQARKQGEKGWDMPFGPLLKRLKDKTAGQVFRADLGAPEGWEAEVPGMYEVKEGWVDVWVGESD